jgi:hypothetical protein
MLTLPEEGGHFLDTIVLGELSASFDRSDGPAVRVRFSGRSSSRDAGKVLAPVFDRALATAMTERHGLEIHFSALEYFNSSTIAALVQFIRAAQERGIPLTVFYDGRQKWQAMSFDALRRAMRPAHGAAPVVFSTDGV